MDRNKYAAELNKKLGFIGLGDMGKPMVKNLFNAGYTVTVWNRSQPGIDECVGYGVVAGSSSRDIAEKSDIVITMVTGSEDVRSIALGPNGIIEGAHPGLILIDTSTISPKATIEIAEELAKKGIRMLDAPVSGYRTGAQMGTLTIMVGGPEDTFQECLPIFNVLGENIFHMGTENGAGHTTKLCNQILCRLGLLAICEAFTIAQEANVDMDKVFSVVSTGVANSPLLGRFGKEILGKKSTASSTAGGKYSLKKDLDLIMEAADHFGTNLPGSTLVHKLFSTIEKEEVEEKGAVGLMRVLKGL